MHLLLYHLFRNVNRLQFTLKVNILSEMNKQSKVFPDDFQLIQIYTAVWVLLATKAVLSYQIGLVVKL